MDEARSCPAGAARGISHREASLRRDPEAPARIDADRARTFHAMKRQQPVGESKLAHLRLTCGEPIAVGTQNPISRDNPQRSARVIRQRENSRAARQRRGANRDVRSWLDEGKARECTDPQASSA